VHLFLLTVMGAGHNAGRDESHDAGDPVNGPAAPTALGDMAPN